MAWKVVFLDADIKALLDAPSIDVRASFQRIVELIQSHGLEHVRGPYAQRIWKGRSGSYA